MSKRKRRKVRKPKNLFAPVVIRDFPVTVLESLQKFAAIDQYKPTVTKTGAARWAMLQCYLMYQSGEKKP